MEASNSLISATEGMFSLGYTFATSCPKLSYLSRNSFCQYPTQKWGKKKKLKKGERTSEVRVRYWICMNCYKLLRSKHRKTVRDTEILLLRIAKEKLFPNSMQSPHIIIKMAYDTLHLSHSEGNNSSEFRFFCNFLYIALIDLSTFCEENLGAMRACSTKAKRKASKVPRMTYSW